MNHYFRYILLLGNDLNVTCRSLIGEHATVPQGDWLELISGWLVELIYLCILSLQCIMQKRSEQFEINNNFSALNYLTKTYCQILK